MSKLRKGFTTGVHAAFAFNAALEAIGATGEEAVTAHSRKMENDDLDVTQGCVLVARVAKSRESLELNPLEHHPYCLEGRLYLYAGRGVGVVSKEGLKPPKGYPAINPTPLNAIKELLKRRLPAKPLFASIGVIDGEKIAKKTANEKVGVLGGLSILGTTGWVKPVSSRAYLQSIEAELDVIRASGYARVVFTLGNRSFERALERYPREQIVEIGNFIYEGLRLAFDRGMDASLYVGIGKAVKIAQGFKNTHNRFGSIDFGELGAWIGRDLDGIVTVKRVSEIVERADLYRSVKKRAEAVIEAWFGRAIEIVIV